MLEVSAGAEKVSLADVERFRTLMRDKCGLELSLVDAKVRYLQLLNLFWILAHKPPQRGEPPYEPPTPPWI